MVINLQSFSFSGPAIGIQRLEGGRRKRITVDYAAMANGTEPKR